MDLACSKDLKHEWQSVRDELLRVLVFFNAAESPSAGLGSAAAAAAQSTFAGTPATCAGSTAHLYIESMNQFMYVTVQNRSVHQPALNIKPVPSIKLSTSIWEHVLHIATTLKVYGQYDFFMFLKEHSIKKFKQSVLYLKMSFDDMILQKSFIICWFTAYFLFISILKAVKLLNIFVKMQKFIFSTILWLIKISIYLK